MPRSRCAAKASCNVERGLDARAAALRGARSRLRVPEPGRQRRRIRNYNSSARASCGSIVAPCSTRRHSSRRRTFDQKSWNDSTSCLGDHMARSMFKEQMTLLLGTQCQKRLGATFWPWRPCGVLCDLSLCSLCCALSHGSLGWEHPREHNKVILEHHFDTVCSFSPERSASVWSSSPLVFIC